MGIEKLIHCLQCCARVDAHNGGCDDCGLEYCGPECQQLCGTAATALSTLQAENEEMQKQLNMFSEFLCYMTGGLLSKTNYTVQEMATAAEDYQQKVCGECDLRAENEKLRAELEQVKRERDAAVKDMEALMWFSGEGCHICAHEIIIHKEPYVRSECALGNCAACCPTWRGLQKED